MKRAFGAKGGKRGPGVVTLEGRSAQVSQRKPDSEWSVSSRKTKTATRKEERRWRLRETRKDSRKKALQAFELSTNKKGDPLKINRNRGTTKIWKKPRERAARTAPRTNNTKGNFAMHIRGSTL